MTTKRLAFDGMLAALCAVLGYIALDLRFFKITFESLPVLLAGFLFGPLDGALVGGIGTIIYQLFKYGVTATTIFWSIPYILAGFLVGLYSKKHSFRTTDKEILILVFAVKLMITILNTGVMYLDSKIYAYWFPGFISANLLIRLFSMVVESAAFGVLIPRILRELRNHI